MNVMDRAAVGVAVGRIYVAAGRRLEGTRSTDGAGRTVDSPAPEFAVYAEALAGVEADVVDEAAKRMVAAEDWRWRPPSPALLLSYVRDVRAERRQRQSAIPSDTGPPLEPEVQRRLLDALRATHDIARGGEPKPIKATLPRVPATAHDLGDHQFCTHDEPEPEEIP